MKNIISSGLFLLICLSFISCEEDEPELNVECEVETDYFGKFDLKYFHQNPLNVKNLSPSKKEQICWDDLYPIQINGGGNGNCGDGYEDVINPFMGLGVTLYEYNQDMPDYTAFLRGFHIQAPFACDNFSTQEKFYQLLENGEYGFSSGFDDFGKFIVVYTDYSNGTKEYSSQNVDNSKFQISVDDIVNIKPDFHTEPNGNNGIPASIEATLTFSCLLKSDDGKFLLIENAELRGRFYRQSPWGYYWDDWGKGWDE